LKKIKAPVERRSSSDQRAESFAVSQPHRPDRTASLNSFDNRGNAPDERPERGTFAHGRVMTVKDVSDYLRVHTSTIYRLLKRGELPAFKMGSDWRFNIESIDQWRLAQTAEWRFDENSPDALVSRMKR